MAGAGGMDQSRIRKTVARHHRRAAVEQVGDDAGAALIGGAIEKAVRARWVELRLGLGNLIAQVIAGKKIDIRAIFLRPGRKRADEREASQRRCGNHVANHTVPPAKSGLLQPSQAGAYGATAEKR